VADSPGLRVGGSWLWSLWREERLRWQMAGPEKDSDGARVPRVESFKATPRWMMRERCPPHFPGPHPPKLLSPLLTFGLNFRGHAACCYLLCIQMSPWQLGAPYRLLKGHQPISLNTQNFE